MFRWNNQKGADNICKTLGYTGGTKYTAPGGSGPVISGNRICEGGEETVWDCPLAPGKKGLQACSHKYDQGVSCVEGIQG